MSTDRGVWPVVSNRRVVASPGGQGFPSFFFFFLSKKKELAAVMRMAPSPLIPNFPKQLWKT